VASDLKKELPLFNARLRSSFLKDNSTISSIGCNSDNGFPVPSLGLGIQEFESFIEGRHPICSLVSKSSNAKVVLSSEIFSSSDSAFVSYLLALFNKKVPHDIANGVSIININSSSVGS